MRIDVGSRRPLQAIEEVGKDVEMGNAEGPHRDAVLGQTKQLFIHLYMANRMHDE